MPFLDEQELASLQEELHDANVKRDELESDLNSKDKELKKTKNKALGLNLFFAIIAGIALAGTYFLYNNKSKLAEPPQPSPPVVETTNNEYQESEEEENEESIENTKTIDENISDLKNSTSGETIYSVQVGVFSKNKYPLLSETIAGTTSQGNLFKYSVGLFKTLEEAQAFRRELVKIGFNDAFVASYIDGERQQIQKPN